MTGSTSLEQFIAALSDRRVPPARVKEAFASVADSDADRAQLVELLTQPAMSHFLTGLPNAGGYMQLVMRYLSQGLLPRYNAFYFNIKGFGLVSEQFGVNEGDAIMRRYADILRKGIQADEIVGHLGGDNFVALVHKERTAELLDFLEVVVVYGEKDGNRIDIPLSCHIGIWEIDETPRDPGNIISYPSIAMNTGKNVIHETVTFVTEDMLLNVGKQKRILESFPHALEQGEFQVYYQPKVDSEAGLLVGAEGLVRWRQQDHMISPGDFIPVLEREGLIGQLDLYVLARVCNDIRGWLDAGLIPVRVSVNISRRDLTMPALVEKIERIIEKQRIPKEYIQIEVTETVDEEEHGLMSRFLNTLWDRGISTAIDDFGSGYSSLAILREFKVNVLKIDRSFINTETFSKKDQIILTDIIHMARELDIDVITEGVEREDQLRFVNHVGCRYIQGFYYDRPLPKAEFEERLRHKVYR